MRAATAPGEGSKNESRFGPEGHLSRILLAEDKPVSLTLLAAGVQDRLRRRREFFLQRVRRQGYTRPAALRFEG